jgi:hypothetical protein
MSKSDRKYVPKSDTFEKGDMDTSWMHSKGDRMDKGDRADFIERKVVDDLTVRSAAASSCSLSTLLVRSSNSTTQLSAAKRSRRPDPRTRSSKSS